MKTKLATHEAAATDVLFNPPNPVDIALVPTDAAPITIAPSSRKPRNGKIARLPKPVRDVVNRMLSLNIPQERIVRALREMEIEVTQSNISNWKTHGGYREWCLAQQHAIRLRLHQDTLIDLLRRHDAPELPEVGLQAAATQLSRFFLTPEATQLLASQPKEYERRVSMLKHICAQLQSLQNKRDDSAKALGRNHDPHRIRNETKGSLERVTDVYTSKIGASAKDPDIPHRNLLPNPTELFNFSDRPPDEPRDSSFLALVEALQRKQKSETTP